MSATGIRNVTRFPELLRRVGFTLALLIVYRIGVFLPTPGVDSTKVQEFFSNQKGILEVANLFSGGALERVSVFALGIMPYISASIILQLLTIVVPTLEKLSKEGEQGRRKITQYTRYGTVILSLIQGFGMSYSLASQDVLLPGVGGIGFYVTTLITLAAGTSFIMWLGEQITERGIGNGISLIIFTGIITRIPKAFYDAWKLKSFFIFVILLLFVFIVIGLIIFFERGQRRIPIQYAKRVVGRKIFGAQSTYLPLKINSAGVIPPIFASSIILFPATIAQFVSNPKIQDIANALTSGPLHTFLYVTFIIFFCYFYTAVSFNPIDVAENIKKNGGSILGIRPGRSTSDYIDRILTRLTLGGAFYISAVCIIPEVLIQYFGIPNSLATVFGGTSLLIVVGVAMDTLAQVESHMLTRNYEGFLGQKVGKFKGRRG